MKYIHLHHVQHFTYKSINRTNVLVSPRDKFGFFWNIFIFHVNILKKYLKSRIKIDYYNFISSIV